VKVLIVDDDPELVSIVIDALQCLGHEVESATCGHEAIAVAARFRPDAALLDVVLPDINGITLAAVLRGVLEDKTLRVVGLSGADIDRLRAASSRGIFDRHLAKPVTLAALEEVLR
jgi:DNA-binding response OmpR family regulator